MFKVIKKEIEWAGRMLTMETGRIARQADGAVLVTYGETTVLCTVVGSKKAAPGQDFFPLTIHYQEKGFAAGKIPGGYIKREGRPSEREVLTSRLIDRPIRPLFPEHFRNEVQVICTVLSHDMQNDPDIISMVGASAAIRLAGLPIAETLGAARVGTQSGNLVLNPLMSNEANDPSLDLCVAGTANGILMVESEAEELSEAQMLEALAFAHEGYQPIIEAIDAFVKEAGPARTWETSVDTSLDQKVFDHLKDQYHQDVVALYAITDKQERSQKLNAFRLTVMEKAVEDAPESAFTEGRVAAQLKTLEKKCVREDVLTRKRRIDGRKVNEVRQIRSETNMLPRVHGSALFTRGETQALVAVTLGTAQDEQIVDALDGEYRERFMLHYNFPPYSVGEAGRLGSPGRREIGHGKLAWRALNPVIPEKNKFPYTIRAVSEITESNGSSSMATVCGTSLALMDAGVPLQNPVSGIAMGLVKEGDQFVVLSDILGDEDHLGDMDFKVAGTEKGITSLQMDIKVTGITQEIMKQALEQAHEGRLHILKEMSTVITTARQEVKSGVPKMETIQINTDKIRDVIGPGGKVIRELCDAYLVKIDINESGEVTIAGTEPELMQKAIEHIKGLTEEPKPGTIHKGKVSRIMDFGALVTFMGQRTGLVHISQLADKRVNSVRDIVNDGDSVYVEILGVEERGKLKLSMRTVDQTTGKKL